MKRSVLARVITLASVILLTTVSAVACTAPPPPPVKILWNFQALSLPSPGAGINAGENAQFVYALANVPAGGQVAMQRAVTSGATTTWATVLRLAVSPLATESLVKPPFGRDSYRLVVTDVHGKLLASAGHTLDVYLPFTLGLLANRPLRSIQITPANTFAYYFQSEIDFPRTSCRQVTGLTAYNDSPKVRVLQVALADSPALTVNHYIGPNAILSPFNVTTYPGQDLDLLVLDNATLGNHEYVRGNAVCFTSNGNY